MRGLYSILNSWGKVIWTQQMNKGKIIDFIHNGGGLRQPSTPEDVAYEPHPLRPSMMTVDKAAVSSQVTAITHHPIDVSIELIREAANPRRNGRTTNLADFAVIIRSNDHWSWSLCCADPEVAAMVEICQTTTMNPLKKKPQIGGSILPRMTKRIP